METRHEIKMILQFIRGVETVLRCVLYILLYPPPADADSKHLLLRERGSDKSSTNTAGASALGGQGLAGTFRGESPTRSPALIRPQLHVASTLRRNEAAAQQVERYIKRGLSILPSSSFYGQLRLRELQLFLFSSAMDHQEPFILTAWRRFNELAVEYNIS